MFIEPYGKVFFELCVRSFIAFIKQLSCLIIMIESIACFEINICSQLR